MDKKAQTKSTSKLEKLHEFARKGGIGTCVATRDTLANTQVDLMFYTGEVITVLKHIKDDIYLGYCEGVIGRFRGSSVSFENDQLRTPISERSDSLDEPTSEKKLHLDSPTTSHFLSPSDAERAIQMRSRSSSISSIDSEKNTSSSSAPPSPVLTPAINITPSPIYDDVSINSSFPTLSKDSRHLHNKEFQNSSPSFNSNPDKTQTSQRESPQISNDQLKLSYQAQSDSPLSLNSRPVISSHSQNASPSSKNQLRQMSSPFPSQNQFNQPIRNNSAPPLINDDSTDPRLLSGNSGKNLTRPGQNFEPPISNDRIQSNDIDSQSFGHYPNTGGIVDSPTTSPNSSPRASRNLGGIPITSGSEQHKVKSQASGLPSGPRQIHGRHRSASNDISSSARSLKYEESGRQRSSSSASSTLSRPLHLPTGNSHSNPSSAPHRVFGQSLLSPTRAEFQIVPPRRTTSIGLSSESSSSANSRPQVKINDRYSPSTTPSPSPISQTKANQFVVTNSPLSQNYGKNSDNFSTRKSAVLQPIVPSRADVSDDPEDFVPSTPILVIESVDDSDVNDSEYSSSEDEDEDEEHVKSNDETRPQSKKEKVLTVDEYGFVHDVDEKEIPEGADDIQRIVRAPGSSKRDSRTIRLYRERETKWVHYLANMDPKVARESKKIKKLVRLGIPESVRGKSWQFIAGVHKYRKAGVYEELCKRERLPIYDVIERDIHRCYPDHIQFREETGFGQDDLHSILKAYAHYNKVVGYCQGMGRLVGMMLMQMPAEDTFWLLVATIEEYMVGYFTPTLSQVRIDSLVFEQLLFEHDPKLAQHLADSDVVPLMYMTQWFMTIFTMTLPWASVLRVWDVFYFEGVKFFHRVGLAILDCARDHILKNCPSSPEILGFLLHIPHELLTPDLLLEAAFKIKLKRSTIEKMKRIAIEIENSNNSSGTDSPNPIHSVIKDKEARKAMMKKAKSSDKLKIDGIEFKMVNESNN